MRKTLEQEKEKERSVVGKLSIRMTVLFIMILLMFAALIGRLWYLQVDHRSFFVNKMKDSGNLITVKTASERGEIYDAKGVALVTNKEVPAITFTRSNRITTSEMIATAKKLVEIVPSIGDDETLTDRDRADYYLSDPEHLRDVASRLTPAESVDKDGDRLTESELYAKYVAKVTPEEKALSAQDEAIAKVFKKMNSAANFATVTISVGNLTAIQQAQIAEHQEELAGIKVGITWQRDYQDTALRSIIGTVTSEKVGLPAEMLDEYLKKGYQRNDRVGTSYVEKGYEDDLKGTHTVTEITVNKSGDIADEKTTQVGKKGSDLKLTIDLDFQTKVEAILNNAFNQGLADGNFNLSSGIFAVALDAKTGAVLSMAGYVHDPETGETTKNALSTIQNTYVPGSTIKAATLTNGWETGVISGNQTLNDQAINLKGSAPKTSLFNKSGVAIPISAVQALEFSSNTYMIQIALKMLGKSYEPNMEVPIGHLKDAFEKARAGYGQYGLGVSTGLDIPGESTGFIPAYGTQSVTAAAFLDESFGQFDNYTTMQLAQYIATIANNGNRISPHIVEGVYDSSTANPLEKITRDVQGKLMNKVDLPSGDMSLIQQGLYQVVNGTSPYTTGRSLAQGLNLTASAKTGTAETFYVHPDKSTTATVSRNMVAYAPSNDPQIAVAVVIPNITIPANGSIPNYHANVTRDILNLYKDMYMK